MEELYKISQIAKFFNLSNQTLRYYDKIGLLSPAIIDENTNYRFYCIDQFDTLYLIESLKRMDIPLDEIKEYSDIKKIGKLEEILKENKVKIEKKLEKLNEIKAIIDFYLDKIELTKTLNNNSIFKICTIPKRYAYFININFKMRDFSDYVDILYGSYINSDIFEMEHEPGKIIITIDVENLSNQELKTYNGIGLLLDRAIKYSTSSKVIDQGLYAITYHVGPYDKIYNTYKDLYEYIIQNNYMINGDSIEFSVTDMAFTNDPKEYVTEIQIPIKSYHKLSDLM